MTKLLVAALLTLVFAQGCATVVVDEECKNSSSIQTEEGCPSSRDYFPGRRQGSATW